METSAGQGKVKETVVIVASALSIIGTLVFTGVTAYNIFNKPALTYETSSHSLPAEETLTCVVVRNEGHASAEAVEINVRVNGEIKNVSVSKGAIAGKISGFELFGESVSIDVKNSSSIISVPYIAQGKKYTVDFMIRPKGSEIIDTLIVDSKNGGKAEKYIEKSSSASRMLFTGFGLGVILTVAIVFLCRSVRLHRLKGKKGVTG